MAGLLLRRDVMLVIIGTLFAAQALLRFTGHLNPHVGWYLYAGGRLLDGAGLYRDIVEVNPPLALWLCAAIVAAARALGVGAAVVFNGAVLLATGVSLFLSGRLLAAATDVAETTRRLLLVFLAGLILFLPAGDFGQRDHIVVLLAMPWVLLRWNRLVDRDVSWALATVIGVLAAIGLWLKPHFILVVLAVEVTMLFAARDARTIFRVETLAIVVFGVVYMTAVRMLWSSGLLSTVALFGSRAFIPIYGVPVDDVVVQLILPLVLATVAAASTGLLTAQLNLLRTIVFVTGAAFLCVYVLQAGHRYQILPALCFLSLAAGLGPARVVAGEVTGAGIRERLVSAVAAIAIVAVFAGAVPNQRVAYLGQPFANAIAAEAPRARTILIASTEVGHPFPLVNENDLVWASRFSSLWLSPYVATKLDDEGGPGDDIARFELDATVSDLIAFQPDIVFVDEAATRQHYRGAPLDYVEFWDKDTRFARFWRVYEKRATAGDFAVYVRSETAP